MTRQEAEKVLQQRFKLPKFYDEQWEAIEKILKGERVLLIEKTGFGKSLCFQFPATLFEGTTVIFSPLIALMRDQVKKFQSTLETKSTDRSLMALHLSRSQDEASVVSRKHDGHSYEDASQRQLHTQKHFRERVLLTKFYRAF